jgi:hypothetical protein
MYKNSVRTPQETHYISTTKTYRLMLFRETNTLYCENHTERTNTFLGSEFLYIKEESLRIESVGFRGLNMFFNIHIFSQDIILFGYA